MKHNITLRRQRIIISVLVAVGISLLGFIGEIQAHVNATSQGCELQQALSGKPEATITPDSTVTPGSTAPGVYMCTVETGEDMALEEHKNSPSFDVVGYLTNGEIVPVVGQERLPSHSVGGSTIWDVLQNGDLVSDDHINTSQYNAFSPPIPTITATSTIAATATETATASAVPTDTPTATTTATGVTTNATRLFDNTSPWNVPIGSNVQLDPNSSEIANEIANGGAHVPAMFNFGMPMYTSTASDPSYTVQDTGGDPLFTAHQPIHIPNVAAPSPPVPGDDSDHWLFIFDKTQNLIFEMWEAQKSGNTWTTKTGDVYSPTGDGVLQIDGSPQSGNGASYFGGVITDADIESGTINHALSLATQYTSSKAIYPMVASDGGSGDIPMGARLQLDPSVDCNALPGASSGVKMVCQALETYGGYIRDTGGVALSMYFEGEDLNDPNRNPPSGSPGNAGRSGGVFGKVGLSDGQDLSAIPWNKLRVLKSWNSFTP